ncbi:hypothetical protein Salat_1782100 [Sesamum alatum]|uniref:Uncharacterized protein n=1 Tax=Sesamum alatum TaxID=300844 RepID=A0AAE1Y9X4_9LAMI|nr:hypothetical protein Salat_1782100 [Sesamum alatum]
MKRRGRRPRIFSFRTWLETVLETRNDLRVIVRYPSCLEASIHTPNSSSRRQKRLRALPLCFQNDLYVKLNFRSGHIPGTEEADEITKNSPQSSTHQHEDALHSDAAPSVSLEGRRILMFRPQMSGHLFCWDVPVCISETIYL